MSYPRSPLYWCFWHSSPIVYSALHENFGFTCNGQTAISDLARIHNAKKSSEDPTMVAPPPNLWTRYAPHKCHTFIQITAWAVSLINAFFHKCFFIAGNNEIKRIANRKRKKEPEASQCFPRKRQLSQLPRADHFFEDPTKRKATT